MSGGNQLQAQSDQVRIVPYGTETDRPYLNDFAGQCLTNCMAHVVRNPSTGDGEIQISKRNGFARTSLNIATHVPDFGLSNPFEAYLAVHAVPFLYDVYVIAVLDGNTYIRIIQVRPEAGTSTLIGTITASGPTVRHNVYFSSGWKGVRNNPTYTLTVNFVDGDGVNNRAYTADATGGTFSTGSLAQITAAGSPWGASVQTVGPILQLNNQWYVASVNGQIYNTGTNVATESYVSQADTNSTDKGWCNIANRTQTRFPERFTGMISYKHHLVVFGKTSIHFFNDEGRVINPGSPLLPTDQALIRFGVISCNHMLNVDDVLYWISYGKSDTVGIWRLDGYTPVKISNKATDDRIISLFSIGFANEVYLFSWMNNSKKHIGIAGINKTNLGYLADATKFPANLTAAWNLSYFQGIALNYCIDDKTWWYLSMDNSNLVGIQPFVLFNRTNTNSYRQYFTRSDSTYIWYVAQVSEDYSQLEAGTVPVIASAQTSSLDFSTERRKRLNKIKPVFQGIGSADTPGTEFYVFVYDKTNDVLSTDFPSRWIDASSPTYRHYVNNLGMFRTLNLCFVDVTSNPMELRFFEMDIAQGTS